MDVFSHKSCINCKVKSVNTNCNAYIFASKLKNNYQLIGASVYLKYFTKGVPCTKGERFDCIFMVYIAMREHDEDFIG